MIFIKTKDELISIIIILIILSALIINSLYIVIFHTTVYSKIKKIIIRSKIINRIKDEKYFLKYQPIYDPRNNKVVGFEALIRLFDKDNRVMAPLEFIPEIEKNNMLFDVSMWVVEKIIKDYSIIREYACVKDTTFYISCNISLNELENDNFVNKVIYLLNKYNIGNNKICLEVIERIKVSDSESLSKNIGILKTSGFKIAIDDFGVEYSNLELMDKIDSDIIKIDKYFVDGLGKDELKNQIILCIYKMAVIKNKVIVLEGVEEEEQDRIIKNAGYDFIYVQGYFYSKPIDILEIEKL